MTSILFIWVLSAGQMQLAASETFYSMEACQSAARAAENALYPEIQARRKAVCACGFQNGKAVNLGEFKTKERAAIANRLFNYWKSLGYEDIPTKPQRRQYIWRHK